MNPVLPKALVVMNIAIISLCGVQWFRETRLVGEITDLAKKDHAKAESIQKLEVNLKKWEEEIARLDTRVEELTGLDKTNKVQIGALTRDLKRTENEKIGLERQVGAYKEAVEKQNENLKAQNEAITQANTTIQEQNSTLKTLAEERNDLVTKLNERTQLYNDVVEKFNTFVAQVEQARNGGNKEK